MGRLDLISNPRADREKSHHVHGFLVSFLFHGLGLCLIFMLAIAYHREGTLPKSGSAPGAPTLTLETMTVMSTPAKPPTLQLPPLPPTSTAVANPPTHPMAKPTPPNADVPVLALQAAKPASATPTQVQMTTHAAVTPLSKSTAKPTAFSIPSSYAPGINDLPHPPYPDEARDNRQTGTVVMNVAFDSRGSVVLAEIAQSSGVPVLDSETRAFIRAHWHSPTYAGQTVCVPVQYTLKNL